MIYFKTALQMLKKNKLTGMLTVIQMSIVLFITAVMVSSVLIRYKYYEPFRDFFESDGIYTSYSFYANKDPSVNALTEMMTEEDFMTELKNANDMISCYSAMLYYPEETNYSFKTLSYDSEILTRYEPELSEGRWLRITDDPKRAEVVVSQNNYGWHVGDVITLASNNFPSDITFEAEIVGELKDGAKVVGNLFTVDKDKDYNSFYTTYSYAVEQTPLLIFSYDALKNIENSPESEIKYAVPQSVRYGSLIKFGNNTNSETVKAAIEKLSTFGSTESEEMSVIHDNSFKYLTEQIRKLLPIILMAFMLVIVSSISGSALSTKKSMRIYVIYAINGLPWRKCTLINLIQTVVLFMISLIITALCLIFAHCFLTSVTTVLWSNLILIIFAFIGLMYVLISMIMPAAIIHNCTPKQIMTR